MKEYPDAAAVLVRRHGIYVWGKASSNNLLTAPHSELGLDWQKAKTQTEVRKLHQALDYMLKNSS